jgi:hypothetical protein
MKVRELKMKKYGLVLLIYCLLCNCKFYYPQQEKPIIVSPLIGKDLDRIERDYFHLFPRIEGFHKAKFYLNNDTSLKVKITTVNNDLYEDTIIQKYTSLTELQTHIKNALLADLRDNPGPDFSVLIKSVRLNFQKMITVNEQSLFTISKSKLGNTFEGPFISEMWGTNLNDISNVRREGKSFDVEYIKMGVAVGGLTGLLIGLLAYSGQEKKEGFESIGAAGGVIVLTLAGAALGLVVGTILGISNVEEEIIINPNTPSGLSSLQSYSIYHRIKAKQKE